MSRASGTAYARAALLGNPSDGYGGRTISFTFRNFSAEVEVAEGERADVRPAAGRPLLEATARRFRRHLEAGGHAAPPSELSLRWRTTIPREVGLGGSSAIVIAALRALSSLYGVSIAREELPTLALSVETQELGIEAGLQDRVAQTYEGLTYMDFDRVGMEERGHGAYEELDPRLLPPLLVAYEARAAEASSGPHGDLRKRYERGDPDVVRTMEEIADLALRGRECLLGGDHAGLGRALDENFEARRRLYPLHPRHVHLVELARSLGASANYAGSGGAIVVVPGPDAEAEELRREFEREGCGAVIPAIAG
jgi:glucuronokinase